MNFLTTLANFFKSTALSVWSKVSGTFFTILNEIEDDEIQIMHDGIDGFHKDLEAGKSFGEAAANLWTFVKNQEGKELSKVSTLYLEAFVAKAEQTLVPAA